MFDPSSVVHHASAFKALLVRVGLTTCRTK